MKTNYQRGFVAKDDRPNTIGNLKKYSTGYGDATNGHRGLARQKRGKKKYIRSRRRFSENSSLRKLAYAAIDAAKEGK